MAINTRDIRSVVSTPEGVLVRIKNKLCVALHIDVHKLKLIIDRFVIANKGENGKSHLDKVNAYNEFTKNTMTIKVFFKFLRVLNLKHIRIDVTVTTSRDHVVTVTEDINLFTQEFDDEH